MLGLRPIALGLVAIAFLLVVLGLTTPSPTSAGLEDRVDREDAVRGILRVTRHPFLWGVALWAATHLVLSGTAASTVLFGGLLVLALSGPPSIDAKRARRLGERWTGFAEATSNVPFAAIAGGRNHMAWGELGLWRIGVAIAVYLAALMLHARLFGVSPLPL